MTGNVMKMESFGEKERLLLEAKLIAPLAIAQILDDAEIMDDAVELALHDMIGSMHPDEALLCLSLCARMVAQANPAVPVARMLLVSAERTLHDYALAWLAEQKGTALYTNDDIKLLIEQIPEDFEELADLIEATMTQVDEFSTSWLVCELLLIQAQSHRDAAESRLEDMNAQMLRSLASQTENVVFFPRTPRH